MATIISDIFTDISQMKHISAGKFHMGYEKNTSFLLIPKSHKVWKSETLDLAALSMIMVDG